MTNRQPTPPSPAHAVPNAPPIDSYYPNEHHQHKHKQYYDHGYDEYESRPRRKKGERKEIQVVQMIPIVQPMQVPAVASLSSSHSVPLASTHATSLSADQQQQLLTYETMQQSPQSRMLLIPAFGQPGSSKILIQAVSTAIGDRYAPLPPSHTSPVSPPPAAAPSTIMITASGSSPTITYDKGSHDDRLRQGSASSASAKKRKRKSQKKVIVLSIKGAEPLRQPHLATAAAGLSSSSSKEEEQERRHEKACTPSDERPTCQAGDNKDKSVMQATAEEVDQEDSSVPDDASHRNAGEGRSFLSQGKKMQPDVVALLPEHEIEQKDVGVPLSFFAHSTTLSPPLILSSPDPDTGNHKRSISGGSSNIGSADQALVVNSLPATGREQSPSSTSNKPDHGNA